MTIQETKMTDEPMTLRDKVLEFVGREIRYGQPIYDLNTIPIINGIAALLEDTGAPAHMRVAKELRGEE